MSAFREAGTEVVPVEKEQVSLWQPIAMSVPVLPMVGALLVDPGLRDGAQFIMFLIVSGLMFLRQLIAHNENVTLNRRLAGPAAQLENKVRFQNVELWYLRSESPPDTPMPAPTRDWLQAGRLAGC